MLLVRLGGGTRGLVGLAATSVWSRDVCRRQMNEGFRGWRLMHRLGGILSSFGRSMVEVCIWLIKIDRLAVAAKIQQIDINMY